ncbi:uncharacterized protein PG998_006182 [Apiospora kogelbergensis]|uniref:uncharacterized protein n=1 Tax=Apiospora kogelbergensis TaxID=1337665 RepID=UPI003130E58A
MDGELHSRHVLAWGTILSSCGCIYKGDSYTTVRGLSRDMEAVHTAAVWIWGRKELDLAPGVEVQVERRILVDV